MSDASKADSAASPIAVAVDKGVVKDATGEVEGAPTEEAGTGTEPVQGAALADVATPPTPSEAVIEGAADEIDEDNEEQRHSSTSSPEAEAGATVEEPKLVIAADKLKADCTEGSNASPETAGEAHEKEGEGGEEDADGADDDDCDDDDGIDDDSPGEEACNSTNHRPVAMPLRKEPSGAPATEDPAGSSLANGGRPGAPTKEGDWGGGGGDRPGAKPAARAASGGSGAPPGETKDRHAIPVPHINKFGIELHLSSRAHHEKEGEGGGEEGEEDAFDFDYSESAAEPLLKESREEAKWEEEGNNAVDFDCSKSAAEPLRKEPRGEAGREEEREVAVDFDYSESAAMQLRKEPSGAPILEGHADEGASEKDDASGGETTDGRLASAAEVAPEQAVATPIVHEEEMATKAEAGVRRQHVEEAEEEGESTRRLAEMAENTNEKEEEEDASHSDNREPAAKPHREDLQRAARVHLKEPCGAHIWEDDDRLGVSERAEKSPAEELTREDAAPTLRMEEGDAANPEMSAWESQRDPSGSHTSESGGPYERDDDDAMEALPLALWKESIGEEGGKEEGEGSVDFDYSESAAKPLWKEPSGARISEGSADNGAADGGASADDESGGATTDGQLARATEDAAATPIVREEEREEAADSVPSVVLESLAEQHTRDPSGSHISEGLHETGDGDSAREGDLMEVFLESFSSQGGDDHVDMPRSSLPLDGDHDEEIDTITGGYGRRSSSDPTLHLPLHKEQTSNLSLDRELRPSPFAAIHIHEATHEVRHEDHSPTPETGIGLSAGVAMQSPSRIRYGATAPPPPQRRRVPGRRSVTLRLLEDVAPPPCLPSTPKTPLLSSVGTPFRSLKRFGLSSRNPAKGGGGRGRPRTGSLDGRLSALDERAAGGNDGGGGVGSTADRGTIVVSWYEGTTSMEMQEHMFKCVLRKLNGDEGGRKVVGLEDVRLLDENVTPHGEVVLCPFLPDGAHFLLKFKTSVERPPVPNAKRPNYRPLYASRAPDSPSAEPSPYPSHANLPSLDPTNDASNMQQRQQQQNEQQMQLLNTVAALLQQQQQQQQQRKLTSHHDNRTHYLGLNVNPNAFMEPLETTAREPCAAPQPDTENTSDSTPSGSNSAVTNAAGRGLEPEMEPIAEHSTTDQLIEEQLRQLNYLFAQRRSGVVTPANGGPSMGTGLMNGTANSDHQSPNEQMMLRAYHRAEKKQVIFVISNYLVLFLSLIALSAEIQSRLPSWMKWVQENYDSVQNCATDRDALVECLANGDFSGLVASFLLWATQSAAAKRIFLFGFDTPKKLWTVVYEALVTAVCWGTSYLFIRRGLNPNTRENFLHKYWKDAVYGSLAGFNAAFMKAVLKNLVPQDVALEALEGGRQLKIFRWLGSASAHPATHPALKESV